MVSCIEGQDDSTLALILTPLCQPRDQRLHTISMNDIRQLVNFVDECAHIGLVHYDLRPNNIMIENDTSKICIIDWVYCFKIESELADQFGGTLRNAAPEVLKFVENRQIQSFARLTVSPTHALHSIVRYIYGLINTADQEKLNALECRRDSNGKIDSKYFRKIEHFWARSFDTPFWRGILKCVDQLDYNGIITGFIHVLPGSASE